MTPNPDPVAALLRTAGPRADAPVERARRVEAAVRLEWQDVVRKRRSRRRAAWVAASCLTSAALMAVMFHAHVGQVAQDEAVGRPASSGPAYVAREVDATAHGAYFRVNNDDRPPDRGVPRHVLASYSQESR
jgi:hypothetical protein